MKWTRWLRAARNRFLLVPTIGTLTILGLSGGVAGHAFSQGASATFAFHTGDSFLAAIDPSLSPDVAKAASGDMVLLEGNGTFSTHPGSAAGNGTFVHEDSSGNVKASGTWTVIGFISFVSYGNGTPQGLPANFFGGQLFLAVHLTPSFGGPGFDGILKVTCGLGDPPAGHTEGVALVVPGIVNFNKHVAGATVYVEM